MLLRRISEHVGAQNWFAVGIDLVIVVVGVFIGIQVSNWNDATARERQAERMLSNVLVDLDSEKSSIGAMRDYWATTKAYSEAAVLGFNNDPSVDDEQFVTSAYQASQAQFPSSNRATYEQLVASGNINIAGSEELRLAMISYYVRDWSRGPVNGAVTPYRENIRRAIPHNIQAAIRKHCGDQIEWFGTTSGLVLPESCDLELPTAEFEEAAENLRGQPELLMDLRHHLGDLNAKLQNLDQLDNQLENLFLLAGREQ